MSQSAGRVRGWLAWGGAALAAAIAGCTAPPPLGTHVPRAGDARDGGGAGPATAESDASGAVAAAVGAPATGPGPATAPPVPAGADGGAAAPDAGAATAGALAVDASPVIAQLGCDTITQAQLDAEVRFVRVLADVGETELTDEQEAQLRQTSLDRLSLEIVVRREAAARGVTAPAADIDTAADLLARNNQVDTATLYAQLESHGVSADEFRADLEFQLLEFKLLQALAVETPPTVTDDEIAAEYQARIAGLDASTVRPLADVRDSLRAGLLADKTEIQGRQWLARRREELMRLQAVRTPTGCVERAPASPAPEAPPAP